MERLVYQPFCGCQVFRIMRSKPNLYRIQYCPLHETAPRLVEALKDIREYVLSLDAMGPETGQVIAGKCFLALSSVEGD